MASERQPLGGRFVSAPRIHQQHNRRCKLVFHAMAYGMAQETASVTAAHGTDYSLAWPDMQTISTMASGKVKILHVNCFLKLEPLLLQGTGRRQAEGRAVSKRPRHKLQIRSVVMVALPALYFVLVVRSALSSQAAPLVIRPLVGRSSQRAGGKNSSTTCLDPL